MKPLYKQPSDYPDTWYNQTGWVIFWIVIFFPIGFYGLWKSDRLSTGWKFALVIGFIFLYALLFSQEDQKYPVVETKKPGLNAPVYDPPVDNDYIKWDYSESSDRMTGKTRKYAKIDCDDKINFDFPYNGGSTFALTIRKSGSKNEILLSCDKCQFLHSYSGDNYVQVKFDNGSPESYSFVNASDGSSDVIFIESSKRFINKLKKSNHLLIRAEFYQATKDIDFSVKGLDWN